MYCSERGAMIIPELEVKILVDIDPVKTSFEEWPKEGLILHDLYSSANNAKPNTNNSITLLISQENAPIKKGFP